MPPNQQLAEANPFSRPTVIVTGAGGSMGRPLALAFANAGANVVVNDVGSSVSGEGSSGTVVEDVVKEILGLGLSAVGDTNSVTEGEKIIESAIRAFGRLDVLINNAGIIQYGSMEEQTPAVFRKIFEVNTLGPISLIHAA